MISLLSLHYLSQSWFILVNCRFTKIQLFSVFIFLYEQYEVGGLERSQNISNSIDHILQLNTLLLDVIFNIF